MIRPFLLALLIAASDAPDKWAPNVDGPFYRGALFDLCKEELDPDALKALERIAEALKRYKNERVLVSGFSDDSEESAGGCEGVSERRAKIVYRWLLAHGIPSAQLAGYRGLGATDMIHRSGTEAQMRRNRRVEFESIGWDPDPVQR